MIHTETVTVAISARKLAAEKGSISLFKVAVSGVIIITADENLAGGNIRLK